MKYVYIYIYIYIYYNLYIFSIEDKSIRHFNTSNTYIDQCILCRMSRYKFTKSLLYNNSIIKISNMDYNYFKI